MRLLGTLGGDSLYLVTESSPESKRGYASELIAWTKQPCVKFVLPFRDVKVDIFLGTASRVTLLCDRDRPWLTRPCACDVGGDG